MDTAEISVHCAVNIAETTLPLTVYALVMAPIDGRLHACERTSQFITVAKTRREKEKGKCNYNTGRNPTAFAGSADRVVLIYLNLFSTHKS